MIKLVDLVVLGCNRILPSLFRPYINSANINISAKNIDSSCEFHYTRIKFCCNYTWAAKFYKFTTNSAAPYFTLSHKILNTAENSILNLALIIDN
jgi:hypothetical protein